MEVSGLLSMEVCTISMEVLCFLHGGYLNGLERRLTQYYAHFWSLGYFSTWTVDVYSCSYVLWMCCEIVCLLLPTVWTYIGY